MMSELYTPRNTGFEGTASDHIKEEIAAAQRRLQNLVGSERLRCFRIYIFTSAYSDQTLSGTFELQVTIEDSAGHEVDYKHTAPTLDDAVNHVFRHVLADNSGPLIPSGEYQIQKLISAP